MAAALPGLIATRNGGCLGWAGAQELSAGGQQGGAQRPMSEGSWASGIFQGATTAAANAVLRTLLSNGECMRARVRFGPREARGIHSGISLLLFFFDSIMQSWSIMLLFESPGEALPLPST